ncbi:hypothetical protein ACFO1B_17025 [Dactylosporangium siamense]|uniref:Uncharacterized protein n=1 Tax=Dactylosporangium siamense TaxID=685454 RepID=A0A919PNC0_9ACTN|nr:hypothetical protein [Dactylosporangium siamense]GIG45545.1 hypothetical protein Dsi01nite_035860 [Dactylosporangium siamense]
MSGETRRNAMSLLVEDGGTAVVKIVSADDTFASVVLDRDVEMEYDDPASGRMQMVFNAPDLVVIRADNVTMTDDSGIRLYPDFADVSTSSARRDSRRAGFQMIVASDYPADFSLGMEPLGMQLALEAGKLVNIEYSGQQSVELVLFSDGPAIYATNVCVVDESGLQLYVETD